MHSSHSLSHLNPNRIVRAAVLNGVPIPDHVKAVLEARGVDVGELETRIRETMEFAR